MMLLQKNEEVLVRRHDGELSLVFDDALYKLNYVGEDIWKLIDGSRGKEDVTSELCSIYEADMGELARDVEDFIENLLRNGLIFEQTA